MVRDIFAISIGSSYLATWQLTAFESVSHWWKKCKETDFLRSYPTDFQFPICIPWYMVRSIRSIRRTSETKTEMLETQYACEKLGTTN
jgi:hypothetical protein